MSKIDDNDGGPAFPPTGSMVKAFPGRAFESREWWPGMTLLDYFAAAALTSMLSTPHVIGDGDYAKAAEMSYRFARAMLAEREKARPT